MTAFIRRVESVTSGIESVGKTGVQFVEIVKIGANIHKDGGSFTLGRFVERRFRIAVLSEQDEEKCSAEISIWAGGTWKFIHRLPARSMTTTNNLREIYDEPGSTLLPENFEGDRNELVRIASETCFE